jgi:choline-glycine betaine transporter
MNPLFGANALLVPLFGSGGVVWLHLPVLIIVISLVYGATRFDDWPHILREARRWVVRLTGFLFIVVFVLFVLAMLNP